jgi:hypothetical protein
MPEIIFQQPFIISTFPDIGGGLAEEEKARTYKVYFAFSQRWLFCEWSCLVLFRLALG